MLKQRHVLLINSHGHFLRYNCMQPRCIQSQTKNHQDRTEYQLPGFLTRSLQCSKVYRKQFKVQGINLACELKNWCVTTLYTRICHISKSLRFPAPDVLSYLKQFFQYLICCKISIQALMLCCLPMFCKLDDYRLAYSSAFYFNLVDSALTPQGSLNRLTEGNSYSIHANSPGLSRSVRDMAPISRSPVRVTISPG